MDGPAPPPPPPELRALLVTGVPFGSHGTGLSAALRRQVEALLPPSNLQVEQKDAPPRFTVCFDRNIHRHVRNGAAVVVFAAAADAAAVLNAVGAGPPWEYDGHPLRVSYAAGRVRDHAFSTWPFELRREVALDPEATYSVTDAVSAARIATLLKEMGQFRDRRAAPAPPPLAVVDAMACVGGNALAFADQFAAVVAMERDPRRYQDLQHNFELHRRMRQSAAHCAAVQLRRQDFGVWLREASRAGEACDVLFIDPPWGGPSYATLPDLHISIDLCAGEEAVTVELTDLLGHCCGVPHPPLRAFLGCDAAGSSSARHLASLVATRVPRTYPIDDLAVAITTPVPVEGHAERHFPFRFQFGANCVLLVIAVVHAVPPDPTGGSTALSFSNADLDDLVQCIVAWHRREGPGGGCGEHRPEFYDHEKRRWIRLKKWISGTQARPAADDTGG
eukprot:EG_transcript_10657